MAGEDWTFWLQMMNLAMGVIILLAVVPVFGSVVWEVAKRARKAHESNNLESELRALFAPGVHTLSVPELGLTMADGGEKIKTSNTDSANRIRRGSDYALPIFERRTGAILPRCARPKDDSRWTGSDGRRPLRNCQVWGLRADRQGQCQTGVLPAPRRSPRAILRGYCRDQTGSVQRIATFELQQRKFSLLRFISVNGTASCHHFTVCPSSL